MTSPLELIIVHERMAQAARFAEQQRAARPALSTRPPMKAKTGQALRELVRARRDQRQRRRIELAAPRHAPIDYGPERGGIKASRSGAGGGGTG